MKGDATQQQQQQQGFVFEEEEEEEGQEVIAQLLPGLWAFIRVPKVFIKLSCGCEVESNQTLKSSKFLSNICLQLGPNAQRLNAPWWSCFTELKQTVLLGKM